MIFIIGIGGNEFSKALSKNDRIILFFIDWRVFKNFHVFFFNSVPLLA